MQECLVAPLLYWEFIAAINIMPVGATFIIKAFTVLEDFTISLIYLLWCAFSEVNFTKPGKEVEVSLNKGSNNVDENCSKCHFS